MFVPTFATFVDGNSSDSDTIRSPSRTTSNTHHRSTSRSFIKKSMSTVKKSVSAYTANDWQILDLQGLQSDKRNVVILAEERAREVMYEKVIEIRRECQQRATAKLLEERAREERHQRLVEGCARALNRCLVEQENTRTVIERTQRYAFGEIVSLEENGRNKMILIARSRRHRHNELKALEKSRKFEVQTIQKIRNSTVSFYAELSKDVEAVDELWFDSQGAKSFSNQDSVRRPKTVCHHTAHNEDNNILSARSKPLQYHPAWPSPIRPATQLHHHNLDQTLDPFPIPKGQQQHPVTEDIAWNPPGYPPGEPPSTAPVQARPATVTSMLRVEGGNSLMIQQPSSSHFPAVRLVSRGALLKAVVNIQRTWKGYCARRDTWRRRETEQNCAIGTPKALKALFDAGESDMQTLHTLQRVLKTNPLNAKAIDIQATVRGFLARRYKGLYALMGSVPSTTHLHALSIVRTVIDFERVERSATKISALFRGFIVRRWLKRAREARALAALGPSESELKLMELKGYRTTVKKSAFNSSWKATRPVAVAVVKDSVVNEIAMIHAKIEERKVQQYLNDVARKRRAFDMELQAQKRLLEFEAMTRNNIRTAIVKESNNRKLQEERLKEILSKEQRLRLRWDKQVLQQREEDKKQFLTEQRRLFKLTEDREMKAIEEHIRLRQEYMGENRELARTRTILDLPNAGARLTGEAQSKGSKKHSFKAVMKTYSTRSALSPLNKLESRKDLAVTKSLRAKDNKQHDDGHPPLRPLLANLLEGTPNDGALIAIETSMEIETNSGTSPHKAQKVEVDPAPILPRKSQFLGYLEQVLKLTHQTPRGTSSGESDEEASYQGLEMLLSEL